MKIDQVRVNYHGNAEFSVTLKEGDHTLLNSEVVKLKKGQHMYTDVSGIGFDMDDTELKRLCNEYSVYLRSDECKSDEGYCNGQNMRNDIHDAAMRLYHSGYDELIELLEGEE